MASKQTYLGAFTLMLCCQLLESSAYAQTAADKETARSSMRRGDDAFAQGNYSEALKAYATANDIMHVPTTGLALGRTQARLGLLVEARDTLLAVARLPEQVGEPTVFGRAREDAGKEAAQLEQRIPSLVIRVSGLPSTAQQPTILINDVKLVGTTEGQARKLNPGPQRIVARLEACPEVAQTISLREGEQQSVELRLATCSPSSVAPRGSKSATEGSSNASHPTRRRSPWVFAGFGLAGAGALTGAIAGAVSLNATSAAKRQCDGNRCPPSAEPNIDKALLFANVSNVAFLLGGVGLAVGVWQIAKPQEPRATGSAATVRAAVGPGGLMVSGEM